MQSSQISAEQAIRLILAAHNKSQAWLAKQVSESPFWVTRRLNGIVNFDLEDLDRIADVFGTDVPGLLGFAESLPQISATKKAVSA